MYIYNNTLCGNGWSGAVYPAETGSLLLDQGALDRSTTVYLSNNILYSTGEPYLAGESAALPGTDYRNCWYGDGPALAWDMTAIDGNPEFVNTGAFNFQLQEGSPCLNAGKNVSTVVARDLLGVPRPQEAAFDLGVYEFVTGTATTSGWLYLPLVLKNEAHTSEYIDPPTYNFAKEWWTPPTQGDPPRLRMSYDDSWLWDPDAFLDTARALLDNASQATAFIWSWCGQMSEPETPVQRYLDMMVQLEREYPDVHFVYMTGHTDGGSATLAYNNSLPHLSAYGAAQRVTQHKSPRPGRRTYERQTGNEDSWFSFDPPDWITPELLRRPVWR